MVLTTSKKHQIKEIAKFRCEWCNQDFREAALHIHHINSNRDDDREANLIVLCPNCHALAEDEGYNNITPTRLRARVSNRSPRRKELIRDILNPNR